MESKLLYPNSGREVISLDVVGSTLHFYSNNGRYGTDELLDSFDMEDLPNGLSDLLRSKPKDLLEMLQKKEEESWED